VTKLALQQKKANTRTPGHPTNWRIVMSENLRSC